MKKLFCVLAVMFFVSGILSAGVINVTTPAAGIAFCTGDTVNIVWHETPKDHADVKIRLFDQSLTVQILQINNSTPNDGSYNWVIPSNILPGQYSILVKTLDNQEFDFSGIITISNCGPPPINSINVTKPGSNTSINKSGSCPIEWNSTGTVTGPLKVGLFNSTGSTFVRSINNNVTINGSLNWAIPNDVSVGSYKIKVQTQNESITGVSEVFSVTTFLTMIRPEERQALFIGAPDLKINIISIPESPDIFQKTLMEFRVENIGKGSSKATKMKIFLGTVNTNTWDVKPLGPGRFMYKTKNITPDVVGIYQWSAIVDAKNEIGDTNRANNYVKYKMKVKGPDLIVCLSNGKRPAVGSRVDIHAEVKNIGEVKSKSCELRFYVKQKGVTTHTIPALNPGATYRVTRKHGWALAGTKKISAVIDWNFKLSESNERNNQIETSFFVRLPHHDRYAASTGRTWCSDGTKIQ